MPTQNSDAANGTLATETTSGTGRARFFAAYPSGAIRTQVLAVRSWIVVRAAAFRGPTATQAVGTAHVVCDLRASESHARQDAALRDAEVRAVSRLLGYLGLGEAHEAPKTGSSDVLTSTAVADGRSESASRADGAGDGGDDPYAAPPIQDSRRRSQEQKPAALEPAGASPSQEILDRIADLDALLGAASRAGVRRTRVRRWRAQLAAFAGRFREGAHAIRDVERIEQIDRRLRRRFRRFDADRADAADR